jgi:predicted transcriptional regulator
MSILSRPYLGELELASLEELWRHGTLEAKALHRVIGIQRGISLTTIQSTLERLFRKRLLTREKVSHAYVYSPAVRREELMERLFAEVIETFSSGGTEQGLAAFVDLAAKNDDDNLAKLEQLIARRRER